MCEITRNRPFLFFTAFSTSSEKLPISIPSGEIYMAMCIYATETFDWENSKILLVLSYEIYFSLNATL